MKWNRKSVLVTGGTGLIGSRIVHKLVKRGARVRVLDNFSAYPFSQLEHFGIKSLDSIEVIVGDIRDRTVVDTATKNVDAIFHEAAFADVAATISSPSEDFYSNVLGTFNLLNAALENHIDRFIFASSASVYGEQTKKEGGVAPQFSENTQTNPCSTYANSKLWGENEATLFYKLYGLKTTSLRYFSIYGIPQVPKKGSHSWVVAIFTMKLLKGSPLTIFGDGTQVRDFIYVDEAAEATILAAEKRSTVGKVINVGTDKPTTIMQLAEIVMDIGCTKMPLDFQPRPKGDPFGGYADITLMKKLLGWEPEIRLEDGVQKYYDWMTTNKHVIPKWL